MTLSSMDSTHHWVYKTFHFVQFIHASGPEIRKEPVTMMKMM